MDPSNRSRTTSHPAFRAIDRSLCRPVYGMSLAMVCLVLLMAPGLVSSEPLAAGTPAPAFSMQGSDGKVHRLQDYQGRYVVIAWFPKAFTGG